VQCTGALSIVEFVSWVGGYACELGQTLGYACAGVILPRQRLIVALETAASRLKNLQVCMKMYLLAPSYVVIPLQRRVSRIQLHETGL
jgi:hypothetical protein